MPGGGGGRGGDVGSRRAGRDGGLEGGGEGEDVGSHRVEKAGGGTQDAF